MNTVSQTINVCLGVSYTITGMTQIIQGTLDCYTSFCVDGLSNCGTPVHLTTNGVFYPNALSWQPMNSFTFTAAASTSNIIITMQCNMVGRLSPNEQLAWDTIAIRLT